MKLYEKYGHRISGDTYYADLRFFDAGNGYNLCITVASLADEDITKDWGIEHPQTDDEALLLCMKVPLIYKQDTVLGMSRLFRYCKDLI